MFSSPVHARCMDQSTIDGMLFMYIAHHGSHAIRADQCAYTRIQPKGCAGNFATLAFLDST